VTDFVISGEQPIFSFQPFETQLEACSITSYELVNANGEAHAGFTLLSQEDDAVAFALSEESTFATVADYAEIYVRGTFGAAGETVTTGEPGYTFRIVCGAATFTAPTSEELPDEQEWVFTPSAVPYLEIPKFNSLAEGDCSYTNYAIFTAVDGV